MKKTGIQLQSDVSYVEQPVEIVDRMLRQLRSQVVPMVKVLWSRHGASEATWEVETEMRAAHPEIFREADSQGGESVTSLLDTLGMAVRDLYIMCVVSVGSWGRLSLL